MEMCPQCVLNFTQREHFKKFTTYRLHTRPLLNVTLYYVSNLGISHICSCHLFVNGVLSFDEFAYM